MKLTEKKAMISNVHTTYRKATVEEVRFYEEELYPLQDQVFRIASVYEDKLYLAGGTALTRFYLNHRLSEDLDFFILSDDLQFIAKDLATRMKNEGFLVEIERIDVFFSRFFVQDQKCRLKVEFIREYNLYGNLPQKAYGIFSDNLEDLGANKITAFEDRAEIKDIIDLYYITQQIPLARLFELAELKRVPIAYEHLLTINTQGISGKALITQDLDPNALEDFIVLLKQETEIVIKKKEKFAAKHIHEVISRQLWDFPREDRNLNPYSIPVLKRRLYQLPLPEQRALSAILH